MLYALVPSLAAYGSKPLFALTVGIILSMYGGGFATIPAYLADVFGTGFVGAIHGRLLTAWSAAGAIGPILFTQMRDSQIAAGVARARVYDRTMYVAAGLLAGGLVCNLLVRPLAEHWFTAVEPAQDAGLARAAAAQPAGTGSAARVTAAWLAVGLPLAWGFYMTILTAVKLFG